MGGVESEAERPEFADLCNRVHVLVFIILEESK